MTVYHSALEECWAFFLPTTYSSFRILRAFLSYEDLFMAPATQTCPPSCPVLLFGYPAHLSKIRNFVSIMCVLHSTKHRASHVVLTPLTPTELIDLILFYWSLWLGESIYCTPDKHMVPREVCLGRESTRLKVKTHAFDLWFCYGMAWKQSLHSLGFSF